MNPLSRLLKDRLPPIDVGVMSHGFAAHGRDYVFMLENSFGPAPGTYRLTFTHVVQLVAKTVVSDPVWRRSWTDEFLDYEKWQAAGEPDGYVFGTNWSLAYPGFEAVESNADAAAWSDRLGYPMFAASVETDRFRVELIFHDAHLEQLSGDADTVSRVITPLT